MKTKELIAQLQKEDPTGEMECNINGIDIISVRKEPGYWDGPYEILTRDDAGFVNGGIYTRNGTKLTIQTYSIKEYVFDIGSDSDHFPVTYDKSLGDTWTNRLEEIIDGERCQAREFEQEMIQSGIMKDNLKHKGHWVTESLKPKKT